MTMLPVGVIPVWKRLLTFELPVVVSAAVGVLAGVSPLAWKTFRTATWGAPQLAAIMLFFAFLFILIAFGAALSVGIGSIIAAPIVVVVSFVWVQSANYFGDNFWVVAPFRPYPQVTGQSLSMEVIAGSALFALVAALLISASVWSLTDSPARRGFAGATAVALVASVLMATIVSGKVGLQLWEVEAGPPRECRESESVAVCVHPAYSTDLDAIIRDAHGVMDNYGDSLPQRPVLIDSSLLFVGRVLSPEVIVIRLNPGEVERVRLEFAQRLSGFWGCSGDPSRDGPEVSAKLQEWLLGSTSVEDVERVRPAMWQYIRENQAAISECRASLEGFPLL